MYFLIGKYFFTFLASLTCAYHYLMKLIKYNRWILRKHNYFSYTCIWKFWVQHTEWLRRNSLLKTQNFQRIYGLLTFLPPSNFAVFDGWCFLLYCLQRAQNRKIAQVNQLFQLLNLICIYGHSFYEFCCVVMKTDVNYNFSKDSPTDNLLKIIGSVMA